MDRRLTPANGRVAHESLRGQVEAARFVPGAWHRVTAPVADLLAAPGGARDRQVLFGQRVLVLEEVAEHAFVQAEHDGYVGYVARAALGPDAAATHWVSAAATHLYPVPDFRRHELAMLSLGAQVTVLADHGVFVETDAGQFLIARHLSPLGVRATDPVTVAEAFLGTPYLWGGNSRLGIDCSGLVQAAFEACGHPCPGDSDQQAASLGTVLDESVPLRRGDLLFWSGHVALVAGPDLVLHANGNDMAVAFEGLQAAIDRLARQGDGPVTVRRRVALPAVSGAVRQG